MEYIQDDFDVFPAREVPSRFEESGDKRYNLIDGDARDQDITKFDQPSFLDNVSLAHQVGPKLRSLKGCYDASKSFEKLHNYLLVSQSGIHSWPKYSSGITIALINRRADFLSPRL